MIVRHPALPDSILVLERQETFGDYARAHGESIADHYERNGVIFVPFMPIDFDLEHFQNITFPPEMKKIGTVDGIEKSVFARREGRFVAKNSHPLVALYRDAARASYVQSQIASFNAQLRRGLSILFPAYHSLREGNITWRLTETFDEGMHLDAFNGGRPLSPVERSLLKIKIFINIDREPRRWRLSQDLPGLLRACRGKLPEELPADVNVLNDVINKFRALDGMPAHELAYPELSAVIVNAEVVSHQVRYGRRLVAGEFFCDQSDMLDPARIPQSRLAGWLKDAGYTVADDAAEIARKYAHMKGNYQNAPGKSSSA